MVVALAPLHKTYNINRIVISTYQSITGTGIKAVEQLNNEAEGKSGDMIYPHPIHKNALPQFVLKLNVFHLLYMNFQILSSQIRYARQLLEFELQ